MIKHLLKYSLTNASNYLLINLVSIRRTVLTEVLTIFNKLHIAIFSTNYISKRGKLIQFFEFVGA